jgi:hypothetical protein
VHAHVWTLRPAPSLRILRHPLTHSADGCAHRCPRLADAQAR